jgi:hypothetical protein
VTSQGPRRMSVTNELGDRKCDKSVLIRGSFRFHSVGVSDKL